MTTEKSFIKKIFSEYMLPDRFPLIFVNTFLAGYFFGEDGLCVFSLLLPIYYLFIVVGTWINFGAFSMTIRSVGEDAGEIARSYSKLALMSSLAVGAILFVALQIFLDPILDILSVPPELRAMATIYGRTLIAVGFLLIVSTYILQFLKIASMQRQLKLIYKVMLALSAAVSYVCIKFLNFGLEGLAVGMSAALIFCMIFEGRRLHKHFGKNLFAPVREPLQSMRRLLYASSAMALSKLLSLSQIFLFNTACFKIYGASGVAVFATLLMAIRVCRTASAMTLQAITPMLSVELGDHNIKAMMLTLKEAIRRGLTFAGLLPIVILWFGATWFAAKTSLTPQWQEVLAYGFQVYALSLIFAAVNAIFLTALLAMRHEIFANVLAVLRSFALLVLFIIWQPHHIWWSFLFAEAVTFVILIAGIFILQKFKGYRTPLLLETGIFRPSCYTVFDFAEQSWATDTLEKFLERQKINSRQILAELQNWRQCFEKNTPQAKKHYLAVHLYTDEKFLHMTLRDNGKRMPRSENCAVKYALGLNSIFYKESLTKGGKV